MRKDVENKKSCLISPSYLSPISPPYVFITLRNSHERRVNLCTKYGVFFGDENITPFH